MTMQTYSHLYDRYEDAVETVRLLEAAGIPHDDIAIVSNNSDNRHVARDGTLRDNTLRDDTVTDHSRAGTGAGLGTLVGGGAGLLAGLGMLAIPGIGPVVAAGWLAATLAGAGVGAAGGGLLGSLVHAGVPEEHAHLYAEGVRRGGTLVTVRADDSRRSQIESVFDTRVPAAVDLPARRAAYQSDSWTAHDPAAPAYTAEQVTTERTRRIVT